MDTHEYRQYFRTNVIPRYYSPALHVLFNFGLLIGSCLYTFLKIQSIGIYETVLFVMMMILGNFVIYFIHRYPLHKKYPFIAKHTFDIHSKQHHRFYTYQNYQFDSPKDFYILFFPMWTVAAFVGGFLPLLYILSSLIFEQPQVWTILFSATLYFLLYEFIHFASHLPPQHILLKFKPLAYMWRHHQTHHDPSLMSQYNFNIVYPLADWLFGCIKAREKYSDEIQHQKSEHD